jgi:hypothetical protein
MSTSFGVTGPALVGAVFAALTLLPLTALTLTGTRKPTRIVAQHACRLPREHGCEEPAALAAPASVRD